MKQAKYIPTKRFQRGFTMIELMITVTLVAVLASIAAPSMRAYVLNNRLNSTSQEFLRTLQTARTEATKRQRNVIVCTSANPQVAVPTCTTSVATGWIMFEDIDGNGDNSNTTELAEVHTFDSSKMTMKADGNHRISYASTGFANPGGSQSIVICDIRGNVDSNGTTSQANSVARGLFISNTGRARITKVLTDITTLLGTGRINSTCP